MVAVVREELRQRAEYAKECEAEVVRVQRRLEAVVTARDLADEAVDATERALAVLEAMGDDDE